MVTTSETENGVRLYFKINENEGEYNCNVYLDVDSIFEYDSFVIKKKDLNVLGHEFEFIQQYCDNYAKNFDDMSIISNEFNEVYESISNAYSMLKEFYIKYIFFNKNCNSTRKAQIADMFDKLGSVKETAHEVAERYTWTNNI